MVLWLAAEPRKEPIGTASLVLGAFAVYVTSFQGPSIQMVFGPQVFLGGYDRLGVECVFMNTGSKPAVVSGLIATDEVGKRLPSFFVSVGADRFELVGGRQKAVSWASYEHFRPIVVDAKAQTATVVWFVASEDAFIEKAKPSVKRLSISAYYQASKGAIAAAPGELKFVVDNPVLTCLERSEADWAMAAKGHLKAKKQRATASEEQRYFECPASVASWQPFYGKGAQAAAAPASP